METDSTAQPSSRIKLTVEGLLAEAASDDPEQVHGLLLTFANRGLSRAAIWLGELYAASGEMRLDGAGRAGEGRLPFELIHAGNFFREKQYRRCSTFLRERYPVFDMKTDQDVWGLYAYSSYLAGAISIQDSSLETSAASSSASNNSTFYPSTMVQSINSEISQIAEDIARLALEDLLDPINIYIAAIALRSAWQFQLASELLVRSVLRCPLNFSAWIDLVALQVHGCDEYKFTLDSMPSSCIPELSGSGLIFVPEQPKCVSLSSVHAWAASMNLLPQEQDCPTSVHWMVLVGYAVHNLELGYCKRARSIFHQLTVRFPNAVNLTTLWARSLFECREFETCKDVFMKLRDLDKTRLEALDVYANVLVCLDDEETLSSLARDALALDKYAPETCCILGNYYTVKGNHDLALASFRRAVSLDRALVSVWILIGHSLVETKELQQAIEAYRTALSIHPKEYRAWFALGGAYELMNLEMSSLYYFQQAAALRPDDSRMWLAAGNVCERLGRLEAASDHFLRAWKCEDAPERAALRLFKIAVNENSSRMLQLRGRNAQLATNHRAVRWAREVLNCRRKQSENRKQQQSVLVESVDMSDELIEALAYLVDAASRIVKEGLLEAASRIAKDDDPGKSDSAPPKLLLEVYVHAREALQILQQTNRSEAVSSETLMEQLELEMTSFWSEFHQVVQLAADWPRGIFMIDHTCDDAQQPQAVIH